VPTKALRTSTALRDRLDGIGQQFLVDFYEVVTKRQPENLEVFAELAQAHTRLGEFESGLALDRHLTRLLPEDPTVRYNLACSLALTERTLESLETLELSINLGYDDAAYLLKDEDLRSLRELPRFQEIVRRLRLATAY
jgi:Flp pilus assembly protein TadD